MSGKRPRDILTIGQVARACGVASRTASRWVDTGMLVGYRIPGSAHRRVRFSELERFVKDHGLGISSSELATKVGK